MNLKRSRVAKKIKLSTSLSISTFGLIYLFSYRSINQEIYLQLCVAGKLAFRLKNEGAKVRCCFFLPLVNRCHLKKLFSIYQHYS